MTMSSDERNWQNGFEKYKQRLSAISTWKGTARGNHDEQSGTVVHHYRDLGDVRRGDTNDEWNVYCGECNAIVNFAGECPNGHRASDPETADPVVINNE